MPGRPKSRLKRKFERKRKQRQRRILLIGGAVAGAVLLILIISWTVMYRYVSRHETDVIAGNVFIGATDVSGMTAEEAKAALDKAMEEYGALTLTMEVGEQSAQATLSELGLALEDEEGLIEEALSYGKDGSIWRRYRELKELEDRKAVIDDVFTVDSGLTSSIISERAVPLEQQAVNATISYNGSGFDITDEQSGKSVDAEASVRTITDWLNNDWNYESGSVKLEEIEQEPEIKREDLESIQDELGSYSTVAGSGTRVQNLTRGAELINGTVLMPGQEFSTLEATLPYTEDNGYVDGGAYENGEVVQSIAGGICQVSTTLYNAVLYAELEVTERSAHSMIVNYVDPSRDAAVAEGVKDFKFKNNYDTPILIEGYVASDGTLQFHIYGKETRAESHSVEFESETLERTEYTTRYVEDTESALGSTSQEGTAINGRTARLWKIVYENGEEVSRDVINNSTYSASEITIKVGTASDNAEASALVSQAIASQNEDTINSAISQAWGMVSGGGE